MALDTTGSFIQTVGNYQLLVKVAEGGMGSVYRARHRDSGQVVAIKIMPPRMAANAVLLRRFEQEFRAASRLDHPNIVRALDYGEEGSSPYLVMEFVEGETLGQKIERDGRLSESEAVRLIVKVAQGLHRAHKQGIIHRDVKPDNIIVTPDGQAKLADLGLVKDVEDDQNLTRTGRGLGTPHFMAPEQFRDAKNADIRCDIYALGATLYMMVTGELPFRSNGPLDAWMKKIHDELTPPREINPELSERIDCAIRRAMSANADKRPHSCREFVEDLTGRSTRKVTPAENTPSGHDQWYLVYKDDLGEMHTAKGTTSAIRRSLQEGLLGDASNVRASRRKTGPFDPMRNLAEFRDLVVEPAALDTPGPSKPGQHTLVSTVALPPLSPAAEPGVQPSQGLAPLIELEPSRSSTFEPWKWFMILLAVALITALAGYWWLVNH